MSAMPAVWLCLCCCLAAWPLSATQAPPPANGDDQPPPGQFPPEISQQDLLLTDDISREFLLQKIQENLDKGQELPILIHGEPQSVPLGPRGRRPPCKEVGCRRRPPFYKLEDFPPGRPTLSNLGALCAAGRKKTSYGPWNLPQTSFSHLSRQGEALNQLELQFARCCQLSEDQRLPCASNEWKKSLDHFCEQEYSFKTRPFYCCRVDTSEARLSCFARQAPFPEYEGEGASLDLSNVSTATLDSICSQASSQGKQRSSPALVQNITESCCKLPESERTLCAQGVKSQFIFSPLQKSQFITAFCSSQRRFWKDPQNCCAQAEGAARNDCFDRSYLGRVSLFRRQKEEKEEEEAEEIVLPTQTASWTPHGA